MRIAIVRRRYAPFGGAERFIENIARELAATGHDLSIISESWITARDTAIKHVSVPTGGLTRWAKLANFQHQVAKVVSREHFDLVQSHERLLSATIFRAGDGVHVAWLARLASEEGPWRAMFRNFDPMHRLIVESERRMASETEMIFVANSALVAQEIVDWLKIPASRIRTIENGVDLATFRPASRIEREAARRQFGLDGDNPVVAFVGSGFDRKGAFHLVEALSLPECRNFRALIAGRDRRQDELRRRIQALGLGDRVHLLGGVEDPLAVYHAADLFALPSLYDPMPNAALEALACGLPLLVTPDTGIEEALRRVGAGVVVTREPADIAAGLSRIVGKHAEMKEAAVSLRSSFDLAAATTRWLALYRELA